MPGLLDIQGLLAQAKKQGLYQGLLGAGIGMLGQGPSPYPIGFGQSLGQGLQGFQQGSRQGYNDTLDQGFGAAKLGLLESELGMKQDELTRKSESDKQIMGLIGPLLGQGGGQGGLLGGGQPPMPPMPPPQPGGPMPMPGGHSSTMAPVMSDQGLPPGVDRGLLNGLVRAESAGNPQAVSPAGAQGLTQLMPGTAQEMGVTDPFDPKQSLQGGAGYLSKQMQTFGGDPAIALAAYNAGPGRVAKGGALPAETQDYVKKVQQYAGDPSTPDYWGQYMQTPEGQAEAKQAVDGAAKQMKPAERQTMQQWLQEDPGRAAAFGAKFMKGAAELGGAAAGAADAIGWAYEQMTKEGRFGPPTTDPILGPGQYDLRTGEFKGKGGTNVMLNNYPEAKGDVKWMEGRATRANDFLTAQASGADTAFSNAQYIESISAAADALRAAGGRTGPFAPITADAGAFVQGLGIDPATLGLPADAGPAKIIESLTKQLALGKIGGPGGLPQNNFSEADRNYINSTVAGLGDTPTAFAVKLEIQKRMNERAIQAQQLWDEGVQSGKYPNNPDGVEKFQRDLRAFVKSAPLFSEEEKKAIMAGKSAGATPETGGKVDFMWDPATGDLVPQ